MPRRALLRAQTRAASPAVSDQANGSARARVFLRPEYFRKHPDEIDPFPAIPPVPSAPHQADGSARYSRRRSNEKAGRGFDVALSTTDLTRQRAAARRRWATSPPAPERHKIPAYARLRRAHFRAPAALVDIVRPCIECCVRRCEMIRPPHAGPLRHSKFPSRPDRNSNRATARDKDRQRNGADENREAPPLQRANARPARWRRETEGCFRADKCLRRRD